MPSPGAVLTAFACADLSLDKERSFRRARRARGHVLDAGVAMKISAAEFMQ